MKSPISAIIFASSITLNHTGIPLVKGANMPVILPLQPSVEFLKAMKIRNEQDTKIKRASNKRISSNEHHRGETDDVNGKEQHAIFSKMHPRHWTWLGIGSDEENKAEF